MKNRERNRYFQIAAGLVLTAAFFLPWVNWQQQPVRGMDLPSGTFFSISESRFRLANPFPQLAFSFHIFWLIPLLAITSALLSWRRQRNSWPALIAGMLALALLMVFYLFSSTLCDLGVDKSALRMVRPAAALSVLAAAGIILSSDPLKSRFWKGLFLILGPLMALGAYKYGEARVMNETFTVTSELKPDHVTNATELLREFLANDSLANARYREKIITVSGIITQVNRNADSTTTLQLAEPSGSYLIFDFEPAQYRILSALKAGDSVSLKGSCSGSIFSEILGTTAISFKRSTLIKK
jgi:hypothetical protein